MEFGLGVLGWSPDQFWHSTPTELRAALRGWQRAQGVDPDAEPTLGTTGITPSELASAQAWADTQPDTFVREADGGS